MFTNSDSLLHFSAIQFSVAKIPSGVYTALAEEHGDLLDAGNDINLRWIANRTWIYSTDFEIGLLGLLDCLLPEPIKMPNYFQLTNWVWTAW